MSNWNEIGFAPKGWQCPVCGAVYSPTTPMCYNCTGRKPITMSTGTFEAKDMHEYMSQLNQDVSGKEGSHENI